MAKKKAAAKPKKAAAASGQEKKKAAKAKSEQPLTFEERLYAAQDKIAMETARLAFHNNHVLAAKHEIKAQNEEIKKIIDEQRHGAQGDLFDQESPQEEKPASAPSAASRTPDRPAPVGGAVNAPGAIPADWQKSPIALLCEYGMPESMVGPLSKASLNSVGDLEKFLENGNPIDALEGIGAKNGAKVISAAASFQKSRSGK